MRAAPPTPPEPPPLPLKAQPEARDFPCDGEQCSLYGVKFGCCVARCFPVTSKIVVEIAQLSFLYNDC
jgi:hypothetical protein